MQSKSLSRKKNSQKIRIAERVTWIGTIIGLIVDLIAIAQIIAFTLNQDIGFSYLNIFISPQVAFIIWFLAIFTYLGFLHLYWENHSSENNFSSIFLGFIFSDLILKFKKPFLLLPIIIWIIVGFPLLALVSILLQGLFTTILFLGLFILVIAKMMSFIARNSKVDLTGRLTQETKDEIESDWIFLENRIKSELERKVFVSYKNFHDLEEVRGYDMQTLWYILALYASKNSDTSKFGALWKLSDDGSDPSLIDTNVLADSRIFLSKNYYIL